MVYKHAVINLTGVLPDNVFPTPNDGEDTKDFVYIYYRNDGQLYLYDTESKHEFNLFNLAEDVVT